METIPFKRHEADAASDKKSTTHTMQTKSAKSKRRGISPWIIILIVVIVAGAGIAILRFSRASEQGTAPLTAAQLTAYVNSQIALQDQTTVSAPLTVNNYSEFQFGSKITPTPAYVSYYIDDVPVARASAKPFSLVIDSSRYSNGTHTLTAVAFDSNGQPLGATKRTITINNAGGLLQDAKNVVTYPWYWLFQL